MKWMDPDGIGTCECKDATASGRSDSMMKGGILPGERALAIPKIAVLTWVAPKRRTRSAVPTSAAS
jgi:hypothetical protein